MMIHRAKCDTYPDVAVGLSHDHLVELWLAEVVDEGSVQRVEVVLDTGALHDEVLSNPHQVIIGDLLQQLSSLQEQSKQ